MRNSDHGTTYTYTASDTEKPKPGWAASAPRRRSPSAPAPRLRWRARTKASTSRSRSRAPSSTSSPRRSPPRPPRWSRQPWPTPLSRPRTFRRFEPSLDALRLRSDVMSPIKILCRRSFFLLLYYYEHRFQKALVLELSDTQVYEPHMDEAGSRPRPPRWWRRPWPTPLSRPRTCRRSFPPLVYFF